MGANFSLIDTLNCNVKIKKAKHDVNALYTVSKRLKISVLPVDSTYDLDDLYPVNNHVDLWNVFVVGKSKDYIVAQVGNKQCLLSKSQLGIDTSKILDTKGGTLPEELFEFFDKVWDITLTGKSLTMYTVMTGKLYLINTYALHNNNNHITGACLFMRDFESIPKGTGSMDIISNNAINNAISQPSLQVPLQH